MTTTTLARLGRRLRHLFRRSAAERDMAEEMRLHLEFEIEERIRHGLSQDEARRTALVDFGGVERFKEEARTARGVRPIEDLIQDVHYAARVLRRSPAFTLVAVLTVAIGIAATTTVFSAAEALLFRPPPVRDPARLFVLTISNTNGSMSNSTSMGQYMYSYSYFHELRKASGPVLDGLAGYRYGTSSLRVGSDAHIVSSMSVSPSYFQVLGVTPIIGRTFTDTADGTLNGQPAPEVVVAYDFWQRELAGDSNIVGRTLLVDSRPRTVVGIAPSGFHGTLIGLVADLWLPANDGSVAMIGRLKPGLSNPQASAALGAIGNQLPVPEVWQHVTRVMLDPINGPPAMARGPMIGFMGMLTAVAMLVLLIIAANIAGMILARSAYRRREVAVRLAIGAGRGRIVRQLLTESVLLCLIGGVIGILLAYWLEHLIRVPQLPSTPRTALDLRFDWRVLSGAFGVALVAGTITGLTPALQSARVDLLSALRGADSNKTRGLGRSRTVFVVAQLALSLVVLLTAGLFARALQRAVRADRGFDTRNVITAELSLSPHGYDATRGEVFYAQLVARLAARPEFESVGLGEWTPLALGHNGQGMTGPDARHVSVTWGLADEHYLATMRIPIVAGRPFSASDTKTSIPVVVVNQTLATQMWPGQSPLGQQLKLNGTRTVVGVVRDGKYRSLDESPSPYAFIPFSQRYSDQMTIHARVRGDVAGGLAAIRAEVAALDANIALRSPGLLSEQIEVYFLPQRFAAWCVGAFGLLGLGLAALGLYGAIAYHVAQRTRELGIRVALGANRRDITAAVLAPAVKAVGLSIVAGLPLAFAIGSLARGFLYGVGASDPVTFIVVPLLLGVVAVVASYLPARRAARVDPMVSLRVD